MSAFQAKLPLELIRDIFGWIDPRCAHRYRELCCRLNEALDDIHFARLNLHRFIDANHQPLPSDIFQEAWISSIKDRFGITSEDGTVSVSPDGLDHLFFAFPKDYRTVYAQSRLKDVAALSWIFDWENGDAMLHPSSKLEPEIGLLTKLQALQLSCLTIHGPIPNAIGHLSLLRYLYLDSLELTGSIPSSIGQLVHLTTLSLSNNNLEGPIPVEITHLSNLVVLSLASNQLSGAIPESIGNLRNLLTLKLRSNELSGPIPPTIGQLIKLDGLHLEENRLTGSIPPEIGNLQRMVMLRLQKNQLHGCIPDEFGTLVNLDILDISDNNLTGPLPDSLNGLYSIGYIDISRNNFSGPISDEASSRFIRCRSINLSHNRFIGKIPETLWNAPGLYEIWLNDTHFDAFEIPARVENLKYLIMLDISNTKAFGRLPVEMSFLGDLEEVKVDGTDLERIVDRRFDGCPVWSCLETCGFKLDLTFRLAWA
ncbi:hypothetical protein HDU99_001961 [Rhizoclosmatium hyalinum]|nr:hypothetical protein HDU99_001961 [Rhizoclosmatium hyalinum]